MDAEFVLKTIGLLGGMSWESSIEYYRIINQAMRARLGGLHSAKCIMYSVDFSEVETLQHQGRWDEAARILVDAARRLERAGADFIVVCTNTMHKVAPALRAGIGIPLLHIADSTADRIKASGLATVGLLGTRFTMEQDFYKGRLEEPHGLRVLVPPPADREIVHRIIYDELCVGEIRAESKEAYLEIMNDLIVSGAEGIILGCTEIELLVGENDSEVPLFPTARIHAVAAVDYALDHSV